MWQTGLAVQVFLPLQISSQALDSFSGHAEERKRNDQCWLLGKSLSYTSKIITVKKLKAGHLNFLPSIIICKLWQPKNEIKVPRHLICHFLCLFFVAERDYESGGKYTVCNRVMQFYDAFMQNPILSDRASLWSKHMIWTGAGTDSKEQPHCFIWGVTSWIRMD